MSLFHCTVCGKIYIMPPAYCRCGGREFRAAETSGRGRIYSCTTLRAAA